MLADATTKKRRAEISKLSGIRGPPALRCVKSIDYVRSVPWEWMHVFLENVIPALVNLTKLMKTMTKFELRDAEIDIIENGLVDWVELYEEYYYQYEEERLPTCTLPIHSLLHITAGIRFCGPVWTSWTFAMEHYCGFLQAGLQSKRFPWSNLNKCLLHMAYLGQLKVKYNLEDELEDIGVICQDGPSRNEREYLIANLPRIMPSWGKLRIRAGGDRICTAGCLRRSSKQSYRNNSFIRVSTPHLILYEIAWFDPNENPAATVIQYGRLERILVCQLGREQIWGNLRSSTLLLALISPVKTDGKDAAVDVVQYSRFSASIITDIRNVKAAVGCIKTRRRWGIIDRSLGVCQAAFAPVVEMDGSEGSSESDSE
ncbi:hypothetical protein BDN67DRAFT_991030 [Paxillus ammoniavirescens]|nr:hypothetical protein BDN67DRAFT_991030 [Paxillus ammoniavirescens]